MSREVKTLNLLTKIRQSIKKRGYSSKEIMNMVIKAQREVRSERKSEKPRRY